MRQQTIKQALTNKSLWVILILVLNILLVLLIVNKKSGETTFSDLPDEMMEETYVGKVIADLGANVIPTGGFDDSDDPPGELKQVDLFTKWQLTDSYEEGEYLIQAYQQFEIYKDSQGNIIKTVPTENFNYLRYCPGCSVTGLTAD